MRAKLLTAWPGLSHHFHLHPWDIGRLSLAELAQYLEALEEIARESKPK